MDTFRKTITIEFTGNLAQLIEVISSIYFRPPKLAVTIAKKAAFSMDYADAARMDPKQTPARRTLHWVQVEPERVN